MHRAALLAAVLLLGGCDLDGWLRWRDIPSFREVSAAEGRRIAAAPGARLLQVREPGLGARLPGADWLDEEEPPPEALSPAGGPVVVLAADEGRALRLAARLARSGIQRVVVVRGGLEAWQTEAVRAASPGAEVGG